MLGEADRWLFGVAVHRTAFDGWSQHVLADGSPLLTRDRRTLGPGSYAVGHRTDSAESSGYGRSARTTGALDAHIVGTALAVATIGFVVLATADRLAMVVAEFFVVYLGIGPVTALGTELVIGTASTKKAGSAAAMSETAMEFGIAFCVGVLGVIGTAVVTNGQPLLESTPAEFTSGLNMVALLCAVITAVLSVLVFRLLKGR